MAAKSFTFTATRYDPDADQEPRRQSYNLEVALGVTVLEALLRIQVEQDGTLALRYACRGAVCGSCAMVINGQVRLACRTQVHGLDTREIIVEPLPNLPVYKDLVVDMGPFWEKYQAVQPWLQPGHPDPERERLVPPDQLVEVEPYTHCILCASCHGVCPAAERDPAYLGPAALAKQYRFLADTRDAADEARLERSHSVAGVWGCDVVWSCVEVCPKGVPPTKGIVETRKRLIKSGRRSLPKRK